MRAAKGFRRGGRRRGSRGRGISLYSPSRKEKNMACGLLVVLTAVLGVLGLLAALGCLAGWRIARHLREEPEAARALVEHVVIPLLVWKPTEPGAEPNEVKGAVV